MIAAIYARKSTLQNVSDDAKSVTRQVDNARRFAAEQGWIVDEAGIFVDDGISGADVRKLVSRQRLLDVIQRGAPFDALIMQAPDRFSRRDGDEAFGELKKIARAGVQVWFYGERTQFKYGTFETNVTGILKGEFAAEFRRAIAVKTYEALERKARAGHVVGGRVFGYDNARVGDHVERRINDREAAAVRRVFELAADGLGKTTIAKRLNAEHVAAPRPQRGRPAGWAASSVREILFRELYHGIIVWNRTKKRNLEGEIDSSARPETAWLRVDAPQLRLVSEDLWRAAHAQLTAHRKAYLRGTDGHLYGHPLSGTDAKYLLIGLARCGVCGGSIEVNSRRHGQERVKFYACACHRRRGPDVCRGLDVEPMQRVDQQVLARLADWIGPARVERVCRNVVEHFADPARNPGARRPALLQQRQALEQAISRLVDAIAGGAESGPIVTAIKAREAERDAIDRELERLDKIGHPVLTVENVKATIAQIAIAWRQALLDESNVPLARQAVRQLVTEKITLRNEVRNGQRGTVITVPATLVRPVAMALNRDETDVLAHIGDSRSSGSGESPNKSEGVAQQVTSPTGLSDLCTTLDLWLARADPSAA